MSKTNAQLQAEIKELEKKCSNKNEALKSADMEIERINKELKAAKENEKPEPKKFIIMLNGDTTKVIQQFQITGISKHDALFLLKHAIANLEQEIRLY